MVKKLLIILSILVVSVSAYAADKAATVSDSKGRVEIVHGDAVMGKRAKKGAELIVNDILRTKRRGYAEVGFVDGTNVKVFEKSRLTINGIERNADGYNAEIQKGKVLFNVAKMENVEGDFRVKTTNSVIGVKGTTFGVVSGGMVTIVEVYNGNVEVLAKVSVGDLESGKIDPTALDGAGKGGDSGENKQTLAASLSAGQGVVLSSSGDVKVYEFSSDGGGKSLIFQGKVDTGKDKGGDKGAGASQGAKGGGSGQNDGDGTDDKAEGGDDQADGDQNADSGEDKAADGTGAADADGGADAGAGAADAGDSGEAPAGDAPDAGDAGVADAGPDVDAPDAGTPSVDDQLFGSIGLVEEAAAGDIGGGLGIGVPDVPADAPGAPDALGDVMAGVDTVGVISDVLVPDTDAGTAGASPETTAEIAETTEVIDNVVEDANDFYSNPDVRPDTEEQIEAIMGTVNINITFK